MKTLKDIIDLVEKTGNKEIFINMFPDIEKAEMERIYRHIKTDVSDTGKEGYIYLGNSEKEIILVEWGSIFNKTYRIEKEIFTKEFDSIPISEWKKLYIPDVMVKGEYTEKPLELREVIRSSKRQAIDEFSNDWGRLLFCPQHILRVRQLAWQQIHIDKEKIDQIHNTFQENFRQLCKNGEWECTGNILQVVKKKNMFFPEIKVIDALSDKESMLHQHEPEEILKMETRVELSEEKMDLDYMLMCIYASLICPVRVKRLSKTTVKSQVGRVKRVQNEMRWG